MRYRPRVRDGDRALALRLRTRDARRPILQTQAVTNMVRWCYLTAVGLDKQT